MRSGLGFSARSRFNVAVAAKNIEKRHRRGGWHGEAGGLEDGFEFAGADHGVDFGDALLDFVAVALDEAAGDDELFRPTGGLVAGHFKDGVDGFLLGRVNEAARVDDEDIGFFGMGSEASASAVEQAHHHLGVDEVLGTA